MQLHVSSVGLLGSHFNNPIGRHHFKDIAAVAGIRRAYSGKLKIGVFLNTGYPTKNILSFFMLMVTNGTLCAYHPKL